ncbi:hypothetical protein Tco_0245097, partial [Tanacetum coccineum]
FSSSRQKSAPYSEQLIKDVPILDDVNISDSKDTDTAHLPKIKTRPDWLNHVPKEDLPATPEPDRVIPPKELPDTKNNWAMHFPARIKIQMNTRYYNRLEI